jgi:hypothetical protein
MEITLTHDESEGYFFNALCNGLDYIGGYGLSLDYNEDDYNNAKKYFREHDSNASHEDVLMRILRDGKELMVVDGEDEDSEYNVSINLSMVHERMSSVPVRHLLDMIEERDDADTADVILQTIFFNEIIFG